MVEDWTPGKMRKKDPSLADVPRADVLVEIGRLVKCFIKIRHSADVPGADVLVDSRWKMLQKDSSLG